MSRVDVVIPCYKYGHFLRACVESVLTQPGVEVRALIMDDASPDNTPEVAAELVRQDPRVQYRRHAVNKGHIETYNTGLEWASGDYTLLLSADDLLAPGALHRAVRVMERHPEVGLAHGRQVFFQTDPGPPETPAEVTDCGCDIVTGGAFIEACCAMAHNPVATPTAVVRTALQHQIGGYRRELPHTGDLDMWLRFATRSAVARVDAHQAYKRMHASNMQHEYVRAALGDLRQRQAAFDTLFREHGQYLPGGGRLQSLTTRRLAEDAFWAASRAFDAGDDAACRRLLEYARQLLPEFASRREWSRLRWKRRLGVRVWGALRPLVERLRGTTAGVDAGGAGSGPRVMPRSA
jgi:glycosyltransferase involved in cell wall biosynthesis